MIDDAQARPRGRARWASPTRWSPSRPGCIGAGDAGFFCKYAENYLTDAGFSTEQINRGGYTIKTTLDPNALARSRTR